VQFHVVTDGQDQFKGAIKQLLTTLTAYGQPPPELFFTDQPSVDNQFFKAQIPSLQAKQNQFDELKTATAVPAELPSAVLTDGSFSLLSSAAQIIAAIIAVHNALLDKPEGCRIIALDCEWDTAKNAQGQVNGSGKVLYHPQSNQVMRFQFCFPIL
jgi:hypothetical protein